MIRNGQRVGVIPRSVLAFMQTRGVMVVPPTITSVAFFLIVRRFLSRIVVFLPLTTLILFAFPPLASTSLTFFRIFLVIAVVLPAGRSMSMG